MRELKVCPDVDPGCRLAPEHGASCTDHHGRRADHARLTDSGERADLGSQRPVVAGGGSRDGRPNRTSARSSILPRLRLCSALRLDLRLRRPCCSNEYRGPCTPSRSTRRPRSVPEVGLHSPQRRMHTRRRRRASRVGAVRALGHNSTHKDRGLRAHHGRRIATP
jgi:hypothetical protein